MTPTNAARFRALLVESEQETRALYAQHLRLAEFEIDEAADGREALAKALTRHFDAIVTATALPGLSGYELCHLLRRDAVTRVVSIVALTGKTGAADIERAFRAGANSVLEKPCSPERLHAEIVRIVHASLNAERRPPAAPQQLAGPIVRRRAKSHVHHRGDTDAPPIAPPELRCPRCYGELLYQRSHLGGVSARFPEQWDYFECPARCGTFQYRQRTRKLRAA